MIVNAAVGGIGVNASFGYSRVDSEQKAELSTETPVNVKNGNVTVESNMSAGKTEKLSVLSAANGETKDNKPVVTSTDVFGAEFTDAAETVIYSYSVALAEATVNVASARFNGTSAAEANIGGTVNGDVIVNNTADSTAHAETRNLSVSLGSIGVMVGSSSAAGNFNAQLMLSSDLECNKVNVNNNFNSKADALIAPASGGAPKVTVADISVNTANAGATTFVNTGVRSDSDAYGITAQDGVEVLAIGTSRALGEIVTPDVFFSVVNVAASVAYARNAVQQNTEIINVDVDNSAAIKVESKLNEKDTVGAEAKLGSSSGSGDGVNLVAAKASIAIADFAATNKARIENHTLNSDDLLDVNAVTKAIAKSDVPQDSSVSIFSGSVNTVYAFAEADTAAEVVTDEMNVGSVSVENEYSSFAGAVTKQSENGIAVLAVKTNVADARAEGRANSMLTVNAGGSVDGDLDVLTSGKVGAKAIALTAGELSAVNVTVNDVLSTTGTEQSASLKFGGELNVGGNVNVESMIRADESNNRNDDRIRTGSFASTGGSAQSSAGIFGVKVNSSEALSSTKNRVIVDGVAQNKLNVAGEMKAIASTMSRSTAEAVTGRDTNVATIGGLSSDAATADVVETSVLNADITTDGKFTAESFGDTSAKATSQNSGGLSVGNDNVSSSYARVGKENERQTAKTNLSNSMVTADTIETLANNTGSAEAVVNNGSRISVGGVTESHLPTYSYYDTAVSVEGCELESRQGDVKVISTDNETASSVANGSSIGFLVNSNDTRGENHVTTDNMVTVGGSVKAADNVEISANSNANMNAVSTADGGGFFDGTDLQAINALTRNVLVKILGNTEIEANYGNIDILSVAGDKDKNHTESRITSGGVVSLGTLNNYVNVNTDSEVQMGNGVKITDRFNTVTIRSNASQNGLDTYGSADCSGLGVDPDVRNHGNIKLSSEVVLGDSALGGSGDDVIEGRYVNVLSTIGELDVYTYGYAKGKGFGADIDSLNNVDVSVASKVDIKNPLKVTGHDGSLIEASSVPAHRSANIDSFARVQLNAIGYAVAASENNINFETNVNIADGFSYTGAELTVDVQKFNDGAFYRDTLETGGFIVRTRDPSNTRSSRGQAVMGKTELNLGDAAGGIYVDISDRGGVREVGVRTPNSYYRLNGDTYEFTDLSNYLPGYAFLKVSKLGQLDVYDQKVIPGAVITNSTDKDVALHNVTFHNSGYINPRVFLGTNSQRQDAEKPSWANVTFHERTLEDGPSLKVINNGDVDVHLNGLISAYDGSTDFIWTHENIEEGAELQKCHLVPVDSVPLITAEGDVNPLWTHELTIEGAGSVGEKDHYFNAWLFSRDGENGILNVDAEGDIFLNVTGIAINMVDEMPDPMAAEGGQTDVDVQKTASAKGDIFMELEPGLEMYWLKDSLTVSIPVPDTLEYMTGEGVALVSDYEITGMDLLERFFVSRDPVTGLSRYELPNGTVILADDNGNVDTIEEGGVIDHISDYKFEYDANGKVVAVIPTPGIRIELPTGSNRYATLTVDADTSITLLMDVISGTWLKSMGLFNVANPNFVVRIADKDKNSKTLIPLTTIWTVKPTATR